MESEEVFELDLAARVAKLERMVVFLASAMEVQHGRTTDIHVEQPNSGGNTPDSGISVADSDSKNGSAQDSMRSEEMHVIMLDPMEHLVGATKCVESAKFPMAHDWQQDMEKFQQWICKYVFYSSDGRARELAESAHKKIKYIEADLVRFAASTTREVEALRAMCRPRPVSANRAMEPAKEGAWSKPTTPRVHCGIGLTPRKPQAVLKGTMRPKSASINAATPSRPDSAVPARPRSALHTRMAPSHGHWPPSALLARSTTPRICYPTWLETHMKHADMVREHEENVNAVA
eukprot:GEMP01058805.1.p1 GENE.GEMP01058805.1~~GEMP01058805.1.p1  ORF type:complete len:290 (+),score=67.27 GEMP01058805.1:160-1029(+)